MFWKSSMMEFLGKGVVVLGLGTAVCAGHAQCGVQPRSLRPSAWTATTHGGHLLRTASDQDDRDSKPTIVGMWHVLFLANTMNGSAIPDTTIDNSIVVWHSDKTEIMNSGRPPQDGNFCLGVWEEVGPRAYQLNHFAWSGNGYAPGTPDGIVGQPIGPVHYREYVTLGPGGKHYTGTFLLEQYDTAGKVAVSFTGVLKATRITLDTTAKDLQ